MQLLYQSLLDTDRLLIVQSSGEISMVKNKKAGRGCTSWGGLCNSLSLNHYNWANTKHINNLHTRYVIIDLVEAISCEEYFFSK